MKDKNYDIVISGAGVVGLSLAVLVKQRCQSARVALLEMREGASTVRVSALNRDAYALLDELGVWQAEKTNGVVSDFDHMYVWDAANGADIQFDAHSIGQMALGYIVPNQAMINALRAQLPARGIDYYAPVRLEQVTEKEACLDLQLDSGEIISTKLLVGADGARSWVREHLGIGMHRWPYGHHALIATVQTEKAHEKTAWQRFFNGEILAFLPLVDSHQCSIVWSTDAEKAGALLAMDGEVFGAAVTAAFEDRLGAVRLVEDAQRAVFPLMMRHVDAYVQSRVALVGDAAHTIHPLAGQGLNLGLRDVVALADLIERGMAAGRDVGGLAWLRRYERARKGGVWGMVAAMESFKWLFGQESGLVVGLRGVGLDMVERLDFFKRFLVGHVS